MFLTKKNLPNHNISTCKNTEKQKGHSVYTGCPSRKIGWKADEIKKWNKILLWRQHQQ